LARVKIYRASINHLKKKKKKKFTAKF